MVDPELIRGADVDLIGDAEDEDAPPPPHTPGPDTSRSIPSPTADTQNVTSPPIPLPHTSGESPIPPLAQESDFEDDVFMDDAAQPTWDHVTAEVTPPINEPIDVPTAYAMVAKCTKPSAENHGDIKLDGVHMSHKQ